MANENDLGGDERPQRPGAPSLVGEGQLSHAELVDRLENYYGFECEGGPLKQCVEWQQLTAALRSPTKVG